MGRGTRQNFYFYFRRQTDTREAAPITRCHQGNANQDCRAILPFVTTRRDPEGIMLSEVREKKIGFHLQVEHKNRING